MPLDRYSDPAAYSMFAQGVQSTGLVDWLLLPDQLTSWWPTSLWNAQNTPFALQAPDCDSWPDAMAMAAYSAATASEVGYAVSLDAVRRGPAELYQSMLTLANVTGGRAMFQIGAGELKQARPFGHKRAGGLERMEDLFKAWAHWAEHPDVPLTMDGNHWKLKSASLGGARQHRPQIWALGGGPRLIDLATSYADGFATMAPFAWSDAEMMERNIRAMKDDLERKGRDPEAFGFGIWVVCHIHDDDEVITRSLENPLTQWVTAAFGRLQQTDWLKEGIEPLFPHDWHYATKLLPVEWDAASAQKIVDQVTPEMSRKAWVHGTPERVAAEISSYIEAGINWVLVGDFLPVTAPPEDPTQALVNSFKVASLLRGA